MSRPARPECATERVAPWRARAAWALYDWASNSFITVIMSFVFSAYFARAVAASDEAGTSQWGTAVALSGLAVALTAPVAGAIADRGGRVKPWLGAATTICVGATAALWYVRPEVAAVPLALVLIGIARYGFDLAFAFYNSLLPTLVPSQRLGRLSGRGWALGYAGGLTSLGLVLVVFIRAEPPPFGLDPATSEHIRIAGPLAALWFALFALPLFVWTPDRPGTARPFGEMVRTGVAQIRRTVARARSYANLFRFLVARLCYVDGLTTMFAFGGIYAAGTFDMSVAQVTAFGVALNVAAAIGATGGGWVDDAIGPKRTILIALGGIMLCGIALVLVRGQTLFWLFGVPLGLFMGPVQSASRSFMVRLSPPELRSEMFGLYTMSGRVSAFLGPAAVALVTDLAGSQRVGIASILIFFVAGAALLLGVRSEQAPAAGA